MTTWVERTARQRSVWQIALCLLVTVSVVSLFALNASYWGPFFHGPTVVDPAGLDAAAIAANNFAPIPTPFATVAGEQVVNTGAQEVTTYDFIVSRVSAGYYALKVGDKVLIVKSPNPPARTVTGSLDPIPYDLKTQLFSSDVDPTTAAQVYPLLLDTKYREPGFMAIFWALLIEAIFGFFAWRSFMRLIGRQHHPAVARAKRWGDLAVTSAALESELQNAVKCKNKGWTLTENYAVQRTMFRFNLFRMQNLLWAYKNATKRSVNFIPVGTAYSATLNFSDGGAVIEGKQKQVDEVLEFARLRAPWAVAGYSDELAALYKKSRNEFAAEVLQQKQAMGR
jgi:Family of unknown function (DUF6709)